MTLTQKAVKGGPYQTHDVDEKSAKSYNLVDFIWLRW